MEFTEAEHKLAEAIAGVRLELRADGGTAFVEVEGEVGAICKTLLKGRTLEEAAAEALRQRALYVYRGRTWLMFDSAAGFLEAAAEGRS